LFSLYTLIENILGTTKSLRSQKNLGAMPRMSHGGYGPVVGYMLILGSEMKNSY